MKEEIDVMEGKTNGIEEETDKRKLTIIGIADVIKTTYAILNASFFNRTVAPRPLLFCYAQYLFH